MNSPLRQRVFLSGGGAALGILWLAAGLPLDAAADAWLLIRADGLGGEDGVEGGAEVGAVGGAAAGARFVELAAVDELARFVEEEEVGCAGGGVGAGDLLRGVVEKGESPAGGTGHGGAGLGGVLRVAV